MRVARVVPGSRPSAALVGSVLTRDLDVGGERWTKGRRLSADDLARLAEAVPLAGRAATTTVLIPEPNDLHEDEAAVRLARAVAGPGLTAGPPVQSRVDLRAAVAGVVRVRLAALERLDAIDPIEVFTVLDGRVVGVGDLVASVKIAPHLVAEAVVVRAETLAARAGPSGVVSVAAFVPRRVAVVVKESIRGLARERFEASIRAKVEGLGSVLLGIDYVEDDAAAVAHALGHRTRRGGARQGRRADPPAVAADAADVADLVLTAGSASTDPDDAFFVALADLGGEIVRHGVPAHPGSMLWLGRIGRVPVLGLPSCGAYSKATAVDLLLPRLLAGEPASRRTVAKLGHGGVLTRDQRYRFPAYARELEAPEG